MPGIIEIDDLCFAYQKGKNVFEHLSLSIDADCKRISITGSDGVGKSTLLKLLFGLIKDKERKIRLLGKQIEELQPDLSYMPQENFLYEELSVISNLHLSNSLLNQKKKSKEELYALLEKIDLLKFKDYKVSALSGGMKQKLALLCTLIKNPRILILDEPTVGVDPISRLAIWQMVNENLSPEACCIYTTAYLEEAEEADVCIALTKSKAHILTPEDISLKCSGLTFFLEAEKYLYLYHALLQHDFEHYLLDICLSEGRIRLLFKDKDKIDAFSDFMHHTFQDFSFKLAARKPILEDLYLKTLKLEDFDIQGHYKFAEDEKKKIEVSLEQMLHEEKPSHTIISLDKVKKIYGSFVAVDASSFEVYEQEIFGLLGPNGAGKTTTFRMMCALLDRSFGKILINNRDLASSKVALRGEIGYVSQKFSLYTDLNCYQNISYFAGSYGLDRSTLKKRLDTLLSIFDLSSYMDTMAKDLPFGVQRELSMLIALLHKPKILFLDEATSGADIIARRKFFLILNLLKKTGVTIVVTTHFLEEAEFCDRFLIQSRGKIICLGRPDEICVNDKGERISVHSLFLNSVN